MLKNLFKKEEKVVDNHLYNPITGKAVPLSEVNDPVFSGEMMGKGAAIIPSVDQVVSPVDGEVVQVFKTKHAITMKADNGAEIIIHVGLDTVSLDGKYFEAHVVDESKVEKGQLLLTFDIEGIKGAGLDPITPIVIPNTAEFKDVVMLVEGEVEAGVPLVKVDKGE